MTLDDYNDRILKYGFKSNKYINNKTGVDHVCLKCGETSKLRPDHLVRVGIKCRYCMSKSGFKLTNDEYDLMIFNSNLERIGDYINTNTKINNRCKICSSEFLILPKCVLRGSGCKCLRSKRKPISNDRYLLELSIRNIDTILPIGYYVNAQTKIEHKCLDCSRKWNVRPSSILNGLKCICKTRISPMSI